MPRAALAWRLRSSQRLWTWSCLSARRWQERGALLKMDDDSWAVVQVNRATVHDRGTDSIKWSIVTQVAGPAVLQPESWLS
mmetsp:Transcript_26738/g.71544  ORF Transcript_26738/g.71544 Transcript_26738/m.71544 type:complete len:81 (-) Transcript_26738:2377-2619(-)